jgi:hypothetical protein
MIMQDKHHEFAKLPLINIIKKGVLYAFKKMTVAEEPYPLKKSIRAKSCDALPRLT